MGYQVVDAAFVEANLGKLPLIDVRTPAEYVQGRIPGAVCVDFFAAQEACKQLASCGYSSLDCYVGSYADWVSDPTRPIER